MSPLPENREQPDAAWTNFKTIALKCQKEFNIKTTNDLLKAKFDNVKKVWQMLKGNQSKNFSTINTNDFKEYFLWVVKTK